MDACTEMGVGKGVEMPTRAAMLTFRLCLGAGSRCIDDDLCFDVSVWLTLIRGVAAGWSSV